MGGGLLLSGKAVGWQIMLHCTFKQHRNREAAALSRRNRDKLQLEIDFLTARSSWSMPTLAAGA